MEDGIKKRYLSLYKAALQGDWITANRIFEKDSSALTAKLLTLQETALHVAISSGGHSIEFVKNLIQKMPKDSLGIPDKYGQTPLHKAAITGNTEVAKILVKKNPRLTQVRNAYNVFNDSPLHSAAVYAHKETVSYLLSITLDEDPSPFANKDGVRLLNLLIIANFYDIAIDLLKRYPMLAQGKDHEEQPALGELVENPHAFASRSRLGFFQRLMYHYFACTCANTEAENGSGSSVKCQQESKKFIFLQSIQSKVLMHKQAMELLKLLISEALKVSISESDSLLTAPTLVAARLGVQEFAIEVINSYPGVVWRRTKIGHTILHYAVKYRQEKIFNLLHHIRTHKLFASLPDDLGNNLLHLAGMLGPSYEISGAALQMQRELQWFKEVEKFVPPSCKENKNDDWKTPRMVFIDEHKNLVKEGEKWMKGTALSCATVAALVVTVVFAGAFTVPGGTKKNQGFPIYLNETSFMIFSTSNALGLFSSTTSLLMFLGILTSRYSEDDFLMELPMRLSIGLITLFFSIASMLVAFIAAFHLVLFHKVRWIAVPFGLVACVPATLFAVLQFPLLYEIVSSTFGPSIFRNHGKDIIF